MDHCGWHDCYPMKCARPAVAGRGDKTCERNSRREKLLDKIIAFVSEPKEENDEGRPEETHRFPPSAHPTPTAGNYRSAEREQGNRTQRAIAPKRLAFAHHHLADTDTPQAAFRAMPTR